jgi:hypothetical protein
MTSWLAALAGVVTLLFLAFSTFLTALLLLTTILLMMPTLLLLGVFQFLFFLSVHLYLPHSMVVKFLRRPKAEECELLALRTDDVHDLAVLWADHHNVAPNDQGHRPGS